MQWNLLKWTRLSTKNKGSVFKFGAIFKAAGPGQWKTSCSLSWSSPQTLEFPWLVPAAGKAEWSWLGEVRAGGECQHVRRARARIHIRALHLFHPKRYQSSNFNSFSVVFFFLDWLLKKRGLGDCTPCAQLRVVVKPSLFPAQLRALLHWDVIERVRSQ